MALLQKWREKYGANATYRKLAKSFYDAGKPGLVETVCAVMTCDYPTEASKSISHATAATISTKFSSQACAFLLLFPFIIVVLSLLLALYFFGADNTQIRNYFTSQLLSAGREWTGVEVCYSHKSSEVAPNNLPHLPGPFIGRDENVEDITHLLHFDKHSHTKMAHIFGLVSQR